MNASRVNPLLTDTDHWLFVGEDIDARVTYSRREADGYAKDLNIDRTDFTVIRFNAVEGTCRNVTDEFLVDEDEQDETDRLNGVEARQWNRHVESYRRPA